MVQHCGVHWLFDIAVGAMMGMWVHVNGCLYFALSNAHMNLGFNHSDSLEC